MMNSPSVFEGRALRVTDWPALDRQAWSHALPENEGTLAEGNGAANWRQSTRELHSRCYGIWLSWLRSEGLLIEEERPEQRVTKARLAAYLQAERALGNGARTLLNHAVGLRHMFEVLAPNEDWKWMLPMIGKLRSAVKPVKNHSDLPSIRELFELGMAIMCRVPDLDNGSPKQHAIWFRNGLAIALLAARPLMRRNNLATIEIDRNLVAEGSDYRLHFSADKMKGRIKRGGPVPSVLTPFIERYIQIYRPRLLQGKPDEHNILFISALGNPITPHNLSDEIGKTIASLLGRRVTTHPFRHAAASSISKEDPDHVGIIPSVLGHSGYRVSEEFYILAEEWAAFNRLDEALDRMMLHDVDAEPTHRGMR
jgi:site-specific recombinase XerD